MQIIVVTYIEWRIMWFSKKCTYLKQNNYIFNWTCYRKDTRNVEKKRMKIKLLSLLFYAVSISVVYIYRKKCRRIKLFIKYVISTTSNYNNYTTRWLYLVLNFTDIIMIVESYNSVNKIFKCFIHSAQHIFIKGIYEIMVGRTISNQKDPREDEIQRLVHQNASADGVHCPTSVVLISRARLMFHWLAFAPPPDKINHSAVSTSREIRPGSIRFHRI